MKFARALLILLLPVLALRQLAVAGEWQLQDVSLLYPLSSQMLTAAEVLPQNVYQKNPLGAPNFKGIDETYRDLRVVGVRVDPIARQIRMVLQPVVSREHSTSLTTEDRAAHVFYQLTPSQFDRFFGEWAALKQQVNPHPKPEPLNIHPAFRDPALAGILWKESKRLLTQYCNSRTISQYTKLHLSIADHTWWQFSGIKRLPGGSIEWAQLDIPHLKGKTEDFGNASTQRDPHTGEVVGMRGQLNFSYDNDVPLAKVVETYSDPTESDRPGFETALQFIARFQNPHLSNPSNVDCVSCHIAQPVRFWMESTLRGLKAKGPADEWFKNPDSKKYDLKNSTIAAHSTRILRAFGYFDSEPALNQRVIHESALVADYLNHKP